MLTRAGSDARQDAEASPRPSPIESLPLELLSRITHLALDPSNGTKHSPENSTILRSLALVSRAWYHSAVRELVASPRFTSSSQLRVFLDLVERLGVGSCVKEIHIDEGGLPDPKMAFEEVENEDLEDGVAKMLARWDEAWKIEVEKKLRTEMDYDGPLARLVDLCGYVGTLRMSGMVQPEFLLQTIVQMPIEVLWLDQSCLTLDSFENLPPTLRALHLDTLKSTTPSLLASIPFPFLSLAHLSCRHIRFLLSERPRTTTNGTILDTITSLLLDTQATSYGILESEYFPEVTHLELVDKVEPLAGGVDSPGL
ncbi:hypothetical protein RQP46_002133 [Phenoliferia psychrophenolica]